MPPAAPGGGRQPGLLRAVGACFPPLLGGTVLEASGFTGSLFQGAELLMGGVNSGLCVGRTGLGCVAGEAASCTSCPEEAGAPSAPGKPPQSVF